MVYDMSEWRELEEYPDYQISDDGQVKSFKKKEPYILKPAKDKSGHLKVKFSIGDDEKSLTVHRLVAKAFIPNPDNLPIVRHLNDIPYDNRVENLAWGTQKDNMADCKRNNHWRKNYHPPTRIKVVAIKDGEFVDTFDSISEAEKSLGANGSHISAVLKGNTQRKRVNGYTFKKCKPRHVGKGVKR